MAPGEQGLSGSRVVAPHPPVVHDPAEFGCTVCHGGQGRATDKADAHGDVPFWPQPMIPLRFAYAGCGSCHTHLRVPNQTELQHGENLVDAIRLPGVPSHRWPRWHAPPRRRGRDGRAGPVPRRAGRLRRRLVCKTSRTHMNRPTDGPWKTSFGPVDEPGRDAIAVYLASRTAAPKLVEAKALFHSLGCRGCHKVGGVGGDDGPDLTLEGEKDPGRLDYTHVPGQPTLANWLAAHFRNPAQVVPGSQMPLLGLTDEQVDLLTFYMLSLRRSNFPEAFWPQDRIRAERFGEREFTIDGATLYGTFCAACHGAKGEGLRYPGSAPFPAIGNPDFVAVAGDELIAETIRRGRPGRRMPAWGEAEGGLRPEEIKELVSYVRRLGGATAQPTSQPAERRWITADAKRGKALYGRFCAGCHGAKGEGTQAPALNNKVLLANATDTYFVETIGRGRRGTEMLGFRDASPIRPALADAEIEAIVAFIRDVGVTKQITQPPSGVRRDQHEQTRD